MLAKLVTVGVLALLCLAALIITQVSYAGHSGAASAPISLDQN